MDSKKARTASVIRFLVNAFQNKSRLEVRSLAVPGSKVTISKARKALGIQSKRIGTRFYWMKPKHTLQEALDKIRPRRSRSTLYRSPRPQKDYTINYALGMALTMRDHGYEMPARDIFEEFKHNGRAGRNWFYKAKRELGIETRWESGHWVWMMPGAAIARYIYSRVPCKHTDLIQQAPWSSHVMFLFYNKRSFYVTDGTWRYANPSLDHSGGPCSYNLCQKETTLIIEGLTHSYYTCSAGHNTVTRKDHEF